MKDKIVKLIGAKQAAHVERKAAAKGITDIWKLGEERARAELGKDAGQGELARLAAVRAQQAAGCIPKMKPETVGGDAGSPSPRNLKPESAEVPAAETASAKGPDAPKADERKAAPSAAPENRKSKIENPKS